MAVYGEDYNSIRRRNQSYFAGANPGAGNQQFPLAPGVAAGNARIAQLQAQGRPAGGMVTSPSGEGSMWVPAGRAESYLNRGYTNYQPSNTTNPSSNPSSVLQSVDQTMGSFFPAASGYGNSQSNIGSILARPQETPKPFGYEFGQNIGRQVRNTAWNTYAGASNLGIGATNFARPAYNALRGAFGLQPSQPGRYFDLY